jgi:hypothetical protein
MRKCQFCGKTISDKEHGLRKYCSNKCKMGMFRKKHNLPKLAHGEHYRFWKELHSCSPEELRILFAKRKSECRSASRYGRKYEIRKLRKEMKIIGMVYEELKWIC